MKGRKTDLIVIALHRGTEKADYLMVPLSVKVPDLLGVLQKMYGYCLLPNQEPYLRAENPLALLKGNHSLRDYGLRDGSSIWVS